MSLQSAQSNFYTRTLPVCLSLAGCLFFFFITASTFLNPYVNRAFNRISTAQMHQMVNQRAHRPFVYRIFVPQLVYTLDAYSPPAFKEFITESLIYEPSMELWMEQKRVEPRHFYRMVLTLMVMLISIALYGMFIYLLTRAAFESHPYGHYTAMLAPVIALAALPMLTRKVFIYDFTVVMLWAAWVWAALRQRWIWLLIFSALAAMTKETAIFLILVFVIAFHDRLHKPRYLLLTALISAITIGIKMWINDRFKHNPGKVFQTHWDMQLTNPAVLYFDIPFCLCVTAYIFLIGAFWNEKPSLLKRGLWLIVPLVIAFFLVGYPREYRVFYEFMPFAVPLMAHSMLMLSRPRGTSA